MSVLEWSGALLPWRDDLDDLKERIGRLFRRPEPRRQIGLYLDTGAGGISQSFPGSDFGFEALPGSNPALEALAAEHADFDLDYVQPAGVLGDVVELQSLQHAARLARRESLVGRAGRMGR